MVISEEGWILIDILLNIGLSIWHVLIDNSQNCLWSLLWIVNLQEWVIMLSLLLTVLAEVKVLANAALVSGTDNWGFSTAIAFNSWVDSLRGGVDVVHFLADFWAVHEIVEDLLALLVELLLDESFEGFSWKATHVLFLVLLSFLVAFALLSVFVVLLGLVRIGGHVLVIVTGSFLIRFGSFVDSCLNE